MSVLLIGSSIATTLLVPPEAFQKGGVAYGRALSYLAHNMLGEIFGTIYDVSTIAILWYAGASAMAGLLTLVPRYLPRYGMAPEWAKATRPLVLLFGAITLLITILFNADVEAQGGAYATGVLVLITSAGVAATLNERARKRRFAAFSLITLVFVYTTLLNVYERPVGFKIAALVHRHDDPHCRSSRASCDRPSCGSRACSPTRRRFASSGTRAAPRSGFSRFVPATGARRRTRRR